MTPIDSPPESYRAVACGRILPVHERVLIMGVLNVTPDSFSDGGTFLHAGQAIEHALRMEGEGADLIDIGGESSRPGAIPIDEAEELRRIMPVLEALGGRLRVPLSIDTTKADVARRALDAGATVINDISGLRHDARMIELAARTGAGIVLMHMQGVPQTMQCNPTYQEVVREVQDFFRERLMAAEAGGIHREQIVLDPGVGFGKNLSHNLALLANLDALRILGRPLLVGVSRKGFIGQLLGRAVGERLYGTAGAVAWATARGARILRVHEVGPMKDVVRTIEAIQRGRES